MPPARHDPPRPQPRARGVVVPVLLSVALLAAGLALLQWSSSRAPVGRVEHEEVSAFSRIRVRRDGDVRALTFVRDNGQEAVQSRVNLSAPGTLLSPYAHGMFASYLYQPHPRRVLIIGLGGGAMVRFLTHHEPQVQIDAVEIDPVVVRLADEYFGVRTGGQVRVHTADGMAFVEAVTEPYDVILMDAFLRPSSDTDAVGVPTRLKTVAFLGRLRQALTPEGVVAFNLNEHEQLDADVAAVRTAFGNGVVYRCPPADNKVLIATAAPMATDDTLRARVETLNGRFGGALAFDEIVRNRE